MGNRLLLWLALVGAASCATAPPKDRPMVVVPQHGAVSVAAEPVRTDGALPAHAVVRGSLDVRRLDDKVGHALNELGPLGLLVLEHSFDIPGEMLDLAEHRGLGGILALDPSRPLTFALQGPSDAERRAADKVDKLASSASPASFAAFADALAGSPSASYRGRILLPSPDVTTTMGRVRALLEGFGLREEQTPEGIDARFASEGTHIVVELTRGPTSLMVDVVRCYAGSKTPLDGAADEAFARLREGATEAPSGKSVEGHTFHVDYEPEALAVLDEVTGAHAIDAELSTIEASLRDAFVARGVNRIVEASHLARGDAGVYFDRVHLDDEDNAGSEALRMTAHLGRAMRIPAATASPSITLPLAGHPETLDIDRGFLDAFRLPGTDLRSLFATVQMAGGLSYAIALPSVLPWMARDQLGALGYGPAPVFQESVRTRFERLGLVGDSAMPEGLFYGLLPAATSRDSAACSLAKSTPCSPGDRLLLGITKRYVGPYFREQDGKRELVISYTRLVAVGDRFVVLAASDKKQLESVKAPVFAAQRRPPAYSETSLGTLGSLAGLTLPKLPDHAIAITALEEGDCSDCPTAETGPKGDSTAIVFRLSARPGATGIVSLSSPSRP